MRNMKQKMGSPDVRGRKGWKLFVKALGWDLAYVDPIESGTTLEQVLELISIFIIFFYLINFYPNKIHHDALN